MPDGICPFAEQIQGVIEGHGGSIDDPVGTCDHTAGGYLSTMRKASFWNDPNGDGEHSDKDSVHFAIGLDGAIVQVLNIFTIAWAQGRLGPKVIWPPYSTMGGAAVSPNEYLISTEHEDAFSFEGVTQWTGSVWTEEQFAADLKVKRWVREEVKRIRGVDIFGFGIDSLAGHYMFDGVNRADCPGRFWRDEYRQRLWQSLEGEEMFVPFSNDGALQLTVEAGDKYHRLWDNIPSMPRERDWEIQFFTEFGGQVDIYHGADRTIRAGQVRYSDTLRVKLDNTGGIWFSGAQNTTKVGILLHGYFK